MIHDTIISIFAQMWPMILICCVIIVSMRITYILKYKVDFILYKELFSLLFVIYVMCLFYVVTFQDVSWSTSNFIPFKEIFRYEFGTKLFFKNVIGNMIMFVPFGFFVSYFLKIEKPITIFMLTIITSITIETTQLVIGRVFDVDDILLNIIGSFIGFIIFYLLNNFKNKLPEILKKPIIYNILILIFIILVIIYLGGLYV